MLCGGNTIGKLELQTRPERLLLLLCVLNKVAAVKINRNEQNQNILQRTDRIYPLATNEGKCISEWEGIRRDPLLFTYMA